MGRLLLTISNGIFLQAIETGDILNKFYDEPFANDEIQSEVCNYIYV